MTTVPSKQIHRFSTALCDESGWWVFMFYTFTGEIQQKGCILPFTPDIYRPILSRLQSEGLKATERSHWLWALSSNTSLFFITW